MAFAALQLLTLTEGGCSVIARYGLGTADETGDDVTGIRSGLSAGRSPSYLARTIAACSAMALMALLAASQSAEALTAGPSATTAASADTAVVATASLLDGPGDPGELAVDATPASYAEGTTAWRCMSECAYTQARVRWRIFDGTRSVLRMDWRGATKAQPCNSSSVYRWRGKGSGVHSENTGALLSNAPWTDWRFNCSPQSVNALHQFHPNITRSFDLRADFRFCHQSTLGSASHFGDRGHWLVTGSGPVWRRVTTDATC